MSDNKVTKLTTSLLPMEDIDQVLRYQYDHATLRDTVENTKNVGNIPANRVAKSVEGDQETVKNALHLGGIPANKYALKEQAESIEVDFEGLKTVYANEIRILRDELYQLKTQLAKRGFIQNVQSYAGFSEAFRSSDPLYTGYLGENVQDSMETNEIFVDDLVFQSLGVDDYIVLRPKNGTEPRIVKITAMDKENNLVTFTPDLGAVLDAGSVEIWKTKGDYDAGTFAFIEHKGVTPGSQAKHSVLDDDTARITKLLRPVELGGIGRGFGYTIRVSDAMAGFLDQFKIEIRRFGNPGSLIAYVIDEKDIPKFKNPVYAKEQGIIIAESLPAYPETTARDMLTFNFMTGRTENEWAILESKDEFGALKRYCVIIMAEGILDEQNYYSITFLQNQHKIEGGDLQLNNMIYEYIEDVGLRTDKDLPPEEQEERRINDSDLYYGLVMRDVVTHDYQAYTDGLYTARIRLPEPIRATRARLMMRVNREGYYSTDYAQPQAIQDGNTVNIKDEEYSMDYREMQSRNIGLNLSADDPDKVIIGTNVRSAIDQYAKGVVVEKGLWLDEGILPVYRNGYRVYLRAIRKEYNPYFNEYEVKENIRVELPLEAVMPDRVKADKKVSDRLIFESGILGEELENKEFNEFEIQIYWKTGYTHADFTKFKDDFHGRIHDLVLTFDHSV